MKRRALLLAGSAGLFFPSAVFAQAPKAPRRIAVLLPGTPSSYKELFGAFQAEMKRLGYVEGRDVTYDVRWAENRTQRLAPLAAELVADGPAVILTASSAGVAAAKKATSTIPIVFGTAGQPVEQGFVASLRRPGGNITGVVVHTMEAKAVEIARAALPQAKRLAILIHKPDPFSKLSLDAFVPAATQLKFEPLIFEVTRAEDLGVAFNEIVRGKADALYVPTHVFIFAHRDYLIERSLEAKLPLLSGFEEFSSTGGLISYGTRRIENFHRAAALVDKILRGANPAELAVEQPEKLQLIVNLKTARAIGVNFSRDFIQRADRVIH